MKLELGEKIIMLRREKGMSQSSLALALDLSRATLSHYERGKREIRTDTLLKIAKFFDVSVEYLTGGTDCRLSVRSYNDVFLEKDRQRIENGAFYELLSKAPTESRETIYNLVAALVESNNEFSTNRKESKNVRNC